MNEKTIHKPYNLLYDNKDTIIIMIHGILGSPLQFRNFACKLYKQGYSVSAVLLGNHGCSSDSFSNGNIEKWIKPVINTIEYFKTRYKNIYLMGHSMGCLISIQQSLNYNIKGLILLAPPIYLKLSLRHFKLCFFNHFKQFKNISKDIKIYNEYQKSYSISNVALFDYLKWGQPFYNLFKLINITKKSLCNVKANTIIFQSVNDETVYYKSAYIFINKMSNCKTKLILLKKSTHAYYTSDERNIIINNIYKFISKNNNGM